MPYRRVIPCPGSVVLNCSDRRVPLSPAGAARADAPEVAAAVGGERCGRFSVRPADAGDLAAAAMPFANRPLETLLPTLIL